MKFANHESVTLAVFPLADVIRAENRAISCRESVEEEICMGSPSAKTLSPRERSREIRDGGHVGPGDRRDGPGQRVAWTLLGSI